MIAYLEGLLAETWGTSCIVVTRGGVGYELDLPAHTMASLPGRGESVALYTSLVVREDAQQLFGFATFEERQVFEVLLTISKVGARTALAILSLYRPDDLRRIVQMCIRDRSSRWTPPGKNPLRTAGRTTTWPSTCAWPPCRKCCPRWRMPAVRPRRVPPRPCVRPCLLYTSTLARTDWLVPAMGPAGFWISYIVALGFGALCYLIRVHHLHGLDAEAVRRRIQR